MSLSLSVKTIKRLDEFPNFRESKQGSEQNIRTLSQLSTEQREQKKIQKQQIIENIKNMFEPILGQELNKKQKKSQFRNGSLHGRFTYPILENEFKILQGEEGLLLEGNNQEQNDNKKNRMQQMVMRRKSCCCKRCGQLVEMEVKYSNLLIGIKMALKKVTQTKKFFGNAIKRKEKKNQLLIQRKQSNSLVPEIMHGNNHMFLHQIDGGKENSKNKKNNNSKSVKKSSIQKYIQNGQVSNQKKQKHYNLKQMKSPPAFSSPNSSFLQKNKLHQNDNQNQNKNQSESSGQKEENGITNNEKSDTIENISMGNSNQSISMINYQKKSIQKLQSLNLNHQSFQSQNMYSSLQYQHEKNSSNNNNNNNNNLKIPSGGFLSSNGNSLNFLTILEQSLQKSPTQKKQPKKVEAGNEKKHIWKLLFHCFTPKNTSIDKYVNNKSQQKTQDSGAKFSSFFQKDTRNNTPRNKSSQNQTQRNTKSSSDGKENRQYSQDQVINKEKKLKSSHHQNQNLDIQENMENTNKEEKKEKHNHKQLVKKKNNRNSDKVMKTQSSQDQNGSDSDNSDEKDNFEIIKNKQQKRFQRNSGKDLTVAHIRQEKRRQTRTLNRILEHPDMNQLIGNEKEEIFTLDDGKSHQLQSTVPNIQSSEILQQQTEICSNTKIINNDDINNNIQLQIPQQQFPQLKTSQTNQPYYYRYQSLQQFKKMFQLQQNPGNSRVEAQKIQEQNDSNYFNSLNLTGFNKTLNNHEKSHQESSQIQLSQLPSPNRSFVVPMQPVKDKRQLNNVQKLKNLFQKSNFNYSENYNSDYTAFNKTWNQIQNSKQHQHNSSQMTNNSNANLNTGSEQSTQNGHSYNQSQKQLIKQGRSNESHKFKSIHNNTASFDNDEFTSQQINLKNKILELYPYPLQQQQHRNQQEEITQDLLLKQKLKKQIDQNNHNFNGTFSNHHKKKSTSTSQAYPFIQNKNRSLNKLNNPEPNVNNGTSISFRSTSGNGFLSPHIQQQKSYMIRRNISHREKNKSNIH